MVMMKFFCPGTTTGDWAEEFHHDHPDPTGYGTWAAFEVDLKTVFIDQNEDAKARDKVENFRQGDKPIDEFFTQFENLCRKAKTPDAMKLVYLEQNLNRRIVEQLATAETQPVGYAATKARNQTIGRLHDKF